MLHTEKKIEYNGFIIKVYLDTDDPMFGFDTYRKGKESRKQVIDGVYGFTSVEEAIKEAKNRIDNGINY